MNYRPVMSLLAITTPWLIYLFASVNYFTDYFHFKTVRQDNNGEVYDFIIVGSGAGGAVVAYRLSTNKNVKVLLLEAGGDPSILNSVPGLALDVLGFEQNDWMHKTIPQKHSCFGLYNNQSSWNAGKVLGGSTTLNYLFYLRGSPHDYDNWANLTGDPSWSYKNVLPYFKKSIKTYRGGYGANKNEYSESNYGFLNIEGRPWAPLIEEFHAAGREFGFPTIDVNGPQKSGFGTVETTQNKGYRYGTYYSIIKQLEYRNNVHISRFSHVTKVKLNKHNEADGVWYIQHGMKKYARASREVILSAGAVNSPHLLMLSGIGPKSHLQNIGIKVKLDLKVGQNLQDHIFAPLMPFVIDKPLSFLADRDFGSGALQYLTKGQDGLQESLDDSAGTDGFLIFPALVRPKSRGEILLKSKNPFDKPLIDPRYYEHPDDLKDMVEGIKTIIKILENAKSMKTFNAHLPQKHLKFCKAYKIRSDAYWQCYARHWTMSVWHPAGTVKMGKRRGDNTAVVDTFLRVIGARGLRVVDASIMPALVNANTMGPTLMIGEKGADMIREYWSNQFLISDLSNYLFFKSSRCFYRKLI